MRKDRELAIRLRRKNKSYNEINKILNIPKSTLAAWFKYDRLSQKVKKLLIKQAQKKSARQIKKLVELNKIRWKKWREEARQEAKKDFHVLAKNPLFIAGLMLYWAEGDSKIKNPVRLTNTDPRMIALYRKFLTSSLGILKENLRVAVIIYPDLQINKCMQYWSKISGIPKSQFYKTQVIKGRHPTKRLSNGICMVIYNGRRIKEKINIWIDLLSQKLIK